MVRLDDDVHARITRIRRMNESYNDVIRRILDFYEERSKKLVEELCKLFNDKFRLLLRKGIF